MLLIASLAASDPLSFQKLNTLGAADGFPDLVAPSAPLDVAPLLRGIPLKRGPAWIVAPKLRYQRTIVEGEGNCSQLSFGLAYQLERDEIDYQIIHLITPGGVESGEGHTVVRVDFAFDGKAQVGLVDLVYGGLPMSRGIPLDAAQLEHGAVPDFSFVALNDAARDPSPYYSQALDETVVGYVPASEVRAYYRFLDRIYVSLGSERAEKLIYDGLALLTGQLPEVFVPRYSELADPLATKLVLHRAALFALRSGLLLVPVILLFEAMRWWARRR